MAGAAVAIEIGAPAVGHLHLTRLPQQRRCILVQQRLPQGLVAAPSLPERMRVAEQFEQQQAEGVHVGRGGHRLAAQLLGRGVSDEPKSRVSVLSMSSPISLPMP